MKLFPAIDLFNGKAVRLYKGDYEKMTIYSENPSEIALDFYNKGAKCIHIVDLEGAKNGDTPNLETIKKIVENKDGEGKNDVQEMVKSMKPDGSLKIKKEIPKVSFADVQGCKELKRDAQGLINYLKNPYAPRNIIIYAII